MVFQTDILLVYGFSGTGKTSLIQCGLASKFESHDWLALPIRRGKNLNESFTKVIEEAAKGTETPAPNTTSGDLDWLEQDWDTDEGDTLVQKKLSPLEQTFKNIYLKYFRPIYLIFDQFEELYILGTKEEQARFVQTVKEILQVEQPVKMIFSIREEYLGFLYEFEKEVPELLRKKLRVESMNLDKVRKIVHGLDEFTGDNIDIKKGEAQAVADAVFAKIRGEEKTLNVQLPYLQVFLDKLYLQITNDETRITEAEFSIAAINQMGDIANVLRDFLEEQVGHISRKVQQNENIVWEVLSPFVTLEGTKEPLSQEDLIRKLPKKDKNLLQTCIKEFVNRRILRYSEGEEMYEIAHDSLALQIADKRSDEEIAVLEIQRLIKSQTNLKADAREMFTEKQLNFMEPFLDKFVLTADEKALIEQSRKQVITKKEAERKRQQEELEQAKAQAAIQKKLSRRAQYIAIGALLVAVLAGWFYFKADKAKDEAITATGKAKEAETEARKSDSLSKKSLAAFKEEERKNRIKGAEKLVENARLLLNFGSKDEFPSFNRWLDSARVLNPRNQSVDSLKRQGKAKWGS